jgi:hypothetical protein
VLCSVCRTMGLESGCAHGYQVSSGRMLLLWLKVGLSGLAILLVVWGVFDFRKFLKTDNRWDDFM